MNQNIIELTGLTKRYGDFTAVDNLTLSVRKGEIYGLLGPNGAGKSTTIIMMLGLSDPTSGSAMVCGINSTKDPIAVKKKVGYLPEDIGFYDDYTGMENLIYTARLNGISLDDAKRKATDLLKRVGLSDEAHKKAGKYSRGMRQRLGLADALIKDPEVIILDEPTLGIDPRGVKELLALIVRLARDEGHTVLLSSHHLQQVQEICDRVGLFVNGKLIAEGDIQALSSKLFSKEPFIINAGLAPSSQEQSVYGVKETIKTIEGVMSVDLENYNLQIECSRDVTNDVVLAIVGSGSGLTYINKKAYGLNDIYNRYFEVYNDEQTRR